MSILKGNYQTLYEKNSYLKNIKQKEKYLRCYTHVAWINATFQDNKKIYSGVN